MNTEFTIFYTDDDAEDLEFFKEASSELGYKLNVITQNNGKKLLYDLDNPPPNPHVIFLDLNMPGFSGFDVLQEIRNSINYKNFPIIVFSTSSDDQTITKSRELGATYYIPKPTDFDRLKKIIKYVLTVDWNDFITNEQNFVYLQK